MLDSIKTLRWLLVAVLPCLAFQCGDRTAPPCDGRYLGGLSLRPVSLAWLPAPAPDSLRFVNSNGFRAVLGRVPMPVADSVVLPALARSRGYYDFSEEYLNPSYGPCGPYFRARRVGTLYQGRNINISLRFNLFRNLDAGPARGTGQVPLTRAVADTLPDVVVLAFNQQYIAQFPVVSAPYRQPRYTAMGEVVYRDSVQLAGRTFRGVYQFSTRPAGAAIQPQHYYFRPGQGLVGFTYTNNEQWARL